jgi:hypothetical protein
VFMTSFLIPVTHIHIPKKKQRTKFNMSGSSYLVFVLSSHYAYKNKACILECIRHNRKRHNIFCHNIYLRFFGPGFGAHTVGLARANSCIFTVSLYLLTIFTKGLPSAILHHCICFANSFIQSISSGK